jgi:aminoglycoside phosphotransferase (APT) family kinase protein
LPLPAVHDADRAGDTRRKKRAVRKEPEMHGDDLRAKEAKLTKWIGTKLPSAQDITIANLEKPAISGYGHVHYFFDLSWREDGRQKTERLVLREEPGGVQLHPDYDIRAQFHTMKCLENSNVPVPRAYWIEEDKSVMGGAFLVMERVDGKILNPQFVAVEPSGLLHESTPEERGKMWRQAVETLARIHTLDWKRLGLSFLGVPKGGTDAIDRQLVYLKTLQKAAGTEREPLVNAVLDWLDKNKFEPKHISLCWGDARLGNMLYSNGKIAAVLDWDMVHLGAPEADLAGFLLIEPQSQLAGPKTPWAGVPDREETIRHYESITGRSVEHMFYWQALRMLRPTLVYWRLVKITPGASPDDSRPRNMLINLAQMIGVQ